MKIFVSVKPNSKTEKIEKVDATHFKVWVKEPPRGGKANKAVIGKMAAALDILKSALVIISGATSRRKVIEIQK